MKKLIFILVLSVQALASNVAEKPFYGKQIQATKAKGCWMTLQGSDKTFRVKFHEYSYFVPLSLTGKKVWVEGKVERKELSIEDTRHYLEDAGASKKEIAAVTKPSFEYNIIAKGVKVVK